MDELRINLTGKLVMREPQRLPDLYWADDATLGFHMATPSCFIGIIKF